MNLSQDYEARFSQDFKFEFSQDADVLLMKLMLNRESEIESDQDLCGTFNMNSTLGSVVPLAMFRSFNVYPW